MDVTVYLPDELRARAKAAGINLSRTLRDAITEELEHMDAIKEAAGGATPHELELENENGDGYVGRVTGTVVHENERNGNLLILTEDERLIGYSRDQFKYWDLTDSDWEETLREWIDDHDAYVSAAMFLGIRPVVYL